MEFQLNNEPSQYFNIQNVFFFTYKKKCCYFYKEYKQIEYLK